MLEPESAHEYNPDFISSQGLANVLVSISRLNTTMLSKKFTKLDHLWSLLNKDKEFFIASGMVGELVSDCRYVMLEYNKLFSDNPKLAYLIETKDIAVFTRWAGLLIAIDRMDQTLISIIRLLDEKRYLSQYTTQTIKENPEWVKFVSDWQEWLNTDVLLNLNRTNT